MNTIEFLENELASFEKAIKDIALNFDDICDKQCEAGMTRHEAILRVEGLKRSLIADRDCVKLLIVRAKSVEAAK